METLPITIAYLEIVSRLSLHHRDPLDWHRVVQCLANGMTRIGSDAPFDAYDIDRQW